MNGKEKLANNLKAANSEGGLQKHVAHIVTSLFTDPDVVFKTTKCLSTMTDKVTFFYKDEVIFELNIPWKITK